MKKTTKRKLLRRWHKISNHPSLKKLGLFIMLSCTLAYVLYQTFTMVGIIQSF